MNTESFNQQEALLPQNLQLELNALRREQIDGGTGWTEEKRLRLLELTRMADEALALKKEQKK